MGKGSCSSLISAFVLLLRLQRHRDCMGMAWERHGDAARTHPQPLVAALHSTVQGDLLWYPPKFTQVPHACCDSQNPIQELNYVTASGESVNMFSSFLILLSFYSDMNTGRKMREKVDTLCMVTILPAHYQMAELIGDI